MPIGVQSPLPRTTMVPPTMIGDVDITEYESPLALDVSKGTEHAPFSAPHHAKKQDFEKRFLLDDPHYKTKKVQPEPLPMFEPSQTYVQQPTYMQPSYAVQPGSLYGGYMPT